MQLAPHQSAESLPRCPPVMNTTLMGWKLLYYLLVNHALGLSSRQGQLPSVIVMAVCQARLLRGGQLALIVSHHIMARHLPPGGPPVR